MTCEACGADRGHLLGCPAGEAALGLPRAPPTLSENPGLSDDLLEARIRRYAFPAVLGAVVVLHALGPLAFVMKLIAAMWFHEAGHALAAWFTGHVAVPLPWVTHIGERGVVTTLVLTGGLGWWAHRSWRAERPLAASLATAGAVLALLGRALPDARAKVLITFAGDAGGMLLGAMAMLAIYARPGSRLHHGMVRWGVLALGAMAYVELLSTWLAARRDPEAIPFGRQEYAGPSDASVLVDAMGWSERQLVNRYLAVGAAAALGLVAAWGLEQYRERRRPQ